MRARIPGRRAAISERVVSGDYIRPEVEQGWGPYARSVLVFSFVGVLALFALANTTWYNTALGIAMLMGRYLPVVLVLAPGGSLARQGHTPDSPGTLPTYRPQFVGLIAAVTVILCALTFLPALALGPLAEGIH